MNENELVEIKEEIIEKEAELPAICKMNVADVEQGIAVAEKFVTILDRVRKTAIKATNVNDWTNEGNKPYLLLTGSQKIVGAFGLKTKDVTCDESLENDDKGDYKIFTYSGTGVWNNVELNEIGSCTTRDPFFGKRSGNLLPLSEVDIPNVKKKAHSNFLNRLIKGVLGLSFTWEDVEIYSDGRINRQNVQSVSYDKGSKGGKTPPSPALKKDIYEVREMLKAVFGTTTDGVVKIQAWIKEQTEFTLKAGKDAGKVIPGKSKIEDISEKQMKYFKPKVEKLYKEIGQ